MSKKKVVPLLLGCLVVGVAVMLAVPEERSDVSAKKPPVQPSAVQSSGGATAAGSAYTLAEVSAHGIGSSCWSVVNGNVYDLTSWIASHPGGEGAILGMCGKDASEAFNQQHGGQGRPERVLESFKIGVLK